MWLPPAEPNGDIGGYRVKYYKTDEGALNEDIYVTANSSLSYIVHNLEEYTNYSVSVQAFVFADGIDLRGEFSDPVVIGQTNPEGTEAKSL